MNTNRLSAFYTWLPATDLTKTHSTVPIVWFIFKHNESWTAQFINIVSNCVQIRRYNNNSRNIAGTIINIKRLRANITFSNLGPRYISPWVILTRYELIMKCIVHLCHVWLIFSDKFNSLLKHK